MWKRKSKKQRNQKLATLFGKPLQDIRWEIDWMHGKTALYCRKNKLGPGTREFSLMCSLGAVMGLFPRIRRNTYLRLVSTFEELDNE